MWYTKSQITLKIKVLEEMSVINAIENKYKKPHVVDVRSGDTVRVHQKVREGSKERVQVFEGLVIKTAKPGSHTSSITVRRIASGVGVEKTYLLHSPLITKIQVVKRSKVRRNYLSYMRARTGKSARLTSVDFDQEEVKKIPEP
jgi:large subunit ribosomal protein L19